MAVNSGMVVDEARRWIGVPFLHQGRNRAGVDCIGLVICVAQRLELIAANFERTDYGRLATRGELSSKITEHCVRLGRPTPGCLLALRWNRETAHVAIFDGVNIVHAYEGAGRVIEHGYRGRWIKFTDSAWALPGVTYE